MAVSSDKGKEALARRVSLSDSESSSDSGRDSSSSAGKTQSSSEEHSEDSLPTDTPEDSQPLRTPSDGTPYPGCRIGHYDNATQSCGLFAHHILSQARDTAKRHNRAPDAPAAGTEVNYAEVFRIVSKVLCEPRLMQAHTLMVFTDTRKPEDVPYFLSTSPGWLSIGRTG